MKCPYCGSLKGKVLETRTNPEGFAIRRRRECVICEKRFSTLETIEVPPIIIVKKNGLRQPFDKSKILAGLLRACQKRPVDVHVIENMIEQIEQDLKNRNQKEIKSSVIGTLILEKLKEVDKIAYVRFVSVYNEFKDVDTFVKELETLTKKD